MDYDLAARELVRALRGRRSQAAARRRLRRSSNVFHAWETGARYPRSSEFLRLLQAVNKSPLQVLNQFAPCRGGTLRAVVSSFLVGLARDRAHSELARGLSVNRNTVARWLSGATEPRLPELLAFIELTTHRLLDFVAEVVDPAAVPSISAAHRDLIRQRELAYGKPWTHAILRALELATYGALELGDAEFIAMQTGVGVEEAQECLSALLESKQIRRHNGRLRLARVLAVDTREDPAKNLALKRHWFSVANERLQHDGIDANGLASYNLFAISEVDFERVRLAHLDYYERLRAIVAESTTNPTRVVLATISLTPLARPLSIRSASAEPEQAKGVVQDQSAPG